MEAILWNGCTLKYLMGLCKNVLVVERLATEGWDENDLGVLHGSMVSIGIDFE